MQVSPLLDMVQLKLLFIIIFRDSIFFLLSLYFRQLMDKFQLQSRQKEI